MKVEITNREKNQALFREEVTLAVGDTKTIPSKKELRQKISALLDKNEDTVFIKKINHNYGSLEITCTAMAYDTAEKAKKIEKEYVINRNLGVKKKKDENAKDAAPAPAKEEKPAKDAKKEETRKEPAKGGEEKTEDKKEAKAEEKTENKEAEEKDG